MRKITTMKYITGGLLVTGLLAGVAGAQVAEENSRIQRLNSGLFTVGRGEGVSVHVSLDDHQTAPSAYVLVQLFDPNGTVVARQDVMLQPGQSTTLQIRRPGMYRAHAETADLPFPMCQRRALVGNAEIFKLQPSVSLPVNPTAPDEVRIESVTKILTISDDARGSCGPD